MKWIQPVPDDDVIIEFKVLKVQSTQVLFTEHVIKGHPIDNGQWVQWCIRGPSSSYHCVTSPYHFLLSGRQVSCVSVCDKCITRPSANYTSGQAGSTEAYEQKTAKSHISCMHAAWCSKHSTWKARLCWDPGQVYQQSVTASGSDPAITHSAIWFLPSPTCVKHLDDTGRSGLSIRFLPGKTIPSGVL